MACDHERLIDYLYGELDEDARAAMETHLQECSACRVEARELGGVGQALRSWSDEEPGPRLVFVPPAPPPAGRRLVPEWLRPSAWWRPALGVGVGLAAVLLILAAADTHISLGNGRLALSLSLYPPEEPAAESQPVTRAELVAAQQQSVELIAALLRESEARQQRDTEVSLTQLLGELEAQRRQDLVAVGAALQRWDRDTGSRLRRNEEILQQITPVLWGQGY